MSETEQPDRQVIPACDVPFEVFEEILKGTGDVKKIGGYKTGFYLMLKGGLPEMDIPANTLYNHKSGSTDIPDVGGKLIDALDHPNIVGVVLTPLSGPATQEAWTKAAQDAGKKVFLEPAVNSPTFLRVDGGYLRNDVITSITQLGLEQGVDGFIAPENPAMAELMTVPEGTTVLKRSEDGTLEGDFNELTAYDVMPVGLPKIVEMARKYTDKMIIYDHQKAGTDAPANGARFAEICKEAGVDTVILFPQAGPDAQDAFTEAAQAQGLGIIVGGLMTHPKYASSDGGYLLDEAVREIYERAVDAGETNFVVPGNKPDKITEIRGFIEQRNSGILAVYWAPGFVAQQGIISEGGKAAGPRFKAIVGRGISKAPDKVAAAIELTSQI